MSIATISMAPTPRFSTAKYKNNEEIKNAYRE
jgi:hypothetical protein